MLESFGFDFRTKCPQPLIVKIIRQCGYPEDTVYPTAYKICLDLFRTYAPLKQTTVVMAIACVELAARLHDLDLDQLKGNAETLELFCRRWATSREEILGSLITRDVFAMAYMS